MSQQTSINQSYSTSSCNFHSTQCIQPALTTQNSGPKYCYCGELAQLKTAWTLRNMGRQFYGCAYRSPTTMGLACHFFKWIDPSLCKKEKEIIPRIWNKLNETENENRTLIVDLKASRDHEKYLVEQLNEAVQYEGELQSQVIDVSKLLSTYKKERHVLCGLVGALFILLVVLIVSR